MTFRNGSVENFAYSILGPRMESVTINKCAIETVQMANILRAMAE
jgi:hypothetical protein